MATATRKKSAPKAAATKTKELRTVDGRVVPKLRTPITPREDNVLLLPDVANTISAGGIVLPNATDEKPSRAIVCAVGPGLPVNSDPLASLGLKVGDYVIFDPYSGTEYDIEGVKYKITRATNITAVIG